MGKSVKKSKGPRRKQNGKLVGLYLLVVIPVTIIFVLVVYMIIQGITERLGLSPIIILGVTSEWMTSGEAVLMYLLWLGLSIALGSIFAYLLVRKIAMG